MAKGIKTGGRTKGTPNKLARAAKDAIAEAADILGGTERLAAWAQEAPENEKAFWATIYPKLVGVTISGDPDAPLTHRIERAIVDPANPDR